MLKIAKILSFLLFFPSIKSLLTSECIYRLHFRGLISGEDPEKESCADGEGESEEDLIRCDNRCDRRRDTRDDLYYTEWEGNTDEPSEDREHDGFDEELFDDISAFCADCFTDTDLFRAFRYCHEEDIHDSDSSDDERDCGDTSEEYLERTRDRRESIECLSLALDSEGCLACIRDFEYFKKSSIDRFFRAIHLLSTCYLDGDRRDIRWSEEGDDRCREGDVYSIICVIESATSLGFRDTDDCEEDIADSDRLAEWIFTSEEVLDDRRPYDCDLISCGRVCFCDECSRSDTRIVYSSIRWSDAIDRSTCVFTSIDDLLLWADEWWYRRDIIHSFQDFHMFHGEYLLIASSLASDISWIRTPRSYGEEIRPKGWYLIYDTGGRTLSDRKQDDYREYSDDNPETR